MDNNFKIVAKTFYGMEEVLAKELLDLGAQNIEIGNRIVSFIGDKGFIYKANLCLHTALKILKPIYEFKANSNEDLYSELYKYQWSDYMNESSTFVFDSVLSGNIFTHSLFVSQKAKDALVDKFRDENKTRPNVDLKHPDFRFHLHINNNVCSLLLDSSGESLHKRGYRTSTNIAPINEVLAAGIIKLSGWDKSIDFIDPMCGSGTFLIEAAMMASNIPANINRDEFAFEKWPDWDLDLFELIQNSQLKKVKEPSIRVYGYDKSPSAILKAKQNINQASLSDFISVDQNNFFDTSKASNEKLHLVTNPPYGERLKGDIKELYKNIGDTLKTKYSNTDAWFISSNLDAMKYVGLRPSRKIKLFNGKLESRLLYFPIYPGTKKIHKLNKP
jgi:putative N6-adenine-specific DNA methylase